MQYRFSRTLLHLSLIDEVGPGAVLKILSGIAGMPTTYDQLPVDLDLEQIYRLGILDFKEFGISLDLSKKIYQGLQDERLLETELELIEKNSINLLTVLDGSYPEKLRNIHLPPPVLYYLGAPLTNDKKLAIVGSRAASSYGRRVIEKLMPDLGANFEIVSGGASGIDSFAHRAAIKSGAKTVVVLGSGLLELYPSSNIKLFDEVVSSGGTLLTPFCCTCKPFSGNFPARNRIIAGLSDGCLVVQAAKKSGALITAQFALQQGREIFAVPGYIDDHLSVGCNQLIKVGAKPVLETSDILEEFGQVGTKIFTASKDEDPIVALLSRALTLDELSADAGVDVAALQDKLFELSLMGKVRQNFAGLWERV